MKTIDKVLSGIENGLTGFLMLSGVIVLFINIIMRYFFHSASSWVEEAERYAIIWVTFIGGSQCAKKGLHVGVDIVIQLLPQKTRKIFFALAQFIGAAFAAFCTYGGVQAFQLVANMNQKSPAMLMPMSIVYVSIPIGFLLMTIRFIIAGIEILQGKSSNDQVSTDDSGNVDMSML